jgi:hypothetical protein
LLPGIGVYLERASGRYQQPAERLVPRNGILLRIEIRKRELISTVLQCIRANKKQAFSLMPGLARLEAFLKYQKVQVGG